MPLITSNKTTGTMRGFGPAKSVCFLGGQGLGDILFMLPTFVQLIRDGYDVTIYTTEALAPLCALVGCKIGDTKEFTITWKKDNAYRFERILDFPEWSTWERRDIGYDATSKIEYFAELCSVTLPESFSWIDLLRPEKIEGEPFILFAPEASSRFRTIPDRKAKELAVELGENVVWLTGDESRTMEDALYSKKKCQSLTELISLVWSAERIVAADSGIACLAAALGKDVTVICSVAPIAYSVGAFQRYIDFEFTEVFGEAQECEQPCYGNDHKGFHECKVLDVPRCLAHLDTEKVLSLSFQE